MFKFCNTVFFQNDGHVALLKLCSENIYLCKLSQGTFYLGGSPCGSKDSMSISPECLNIDMKKTVPMTSELIQHHLVCFLPRRHYGWKGNMIDPYDSAAMEKYLAKKTAARLSLSDICCPLPVIPQSAGQTSTI